MKRKRNHETSNFFNIHLNLPKVLLEIILQYCCMSYCSNCKKIYPQNFVCLSCPNFEKVIYKTEEFRSQGTKSFSSQKIFDNWQDQMVWDYIYTIISKNYYSYRDWTVAGEKKHKIIILTERQRLTRSRLWSVWWSVAFLSSIY